MEYPGAVYHITSRGNARQDIFLSDSDRDDFLNILARVIDRYRWLCHAYCLMDNHYHLLIETPDPTLSLGMRQLNGVYTQTFNRHEKLGSWLSAERDRRAPRAGSILLPSAAGCAIGNVLRVHDYVIA